MRILITQEADWLNRNPAQQHHLAEMLSLRGHQVRAIDYEILWRTQPKTDIYSRRQVFGNVSKIHRSAGVTLIRPGIVKVPCLDYVSLLLSHRREIRRQITEFSPDVIVGFGILNSYLAARAARAHHIPFLYYWIDVLHLLIPFGPFRPLGKRVEREALKRADGVLVINEVLRDYVVGMGASPERVRVLRAGIDPGVFEAGTDGRAVRAEYGLDDADAVLFFMGWLYHFSGLREVALEMARAEDHNLKLLIVGEGDAYDELRKIQEEHGLQSNLILAGKKPYEEIPGFIAASDICLLPAYPGEKTMQDIVPIKMYEYMAMGRPVIATRLPGIVKEFGDDNGVVYVDGPQDVLARAAGLARNGSIAELGSKARAFAAKNTWDSVTDEFERILEQAVREKRDGG